MAGPGLFQHGVGPWNGDSMSDKDELKDNPDEDEDWMSMAELRFNRLFTWDDAGEEAEMVEEPEWEDEDLQLDTGEEEFQQLQNQQGSNIW